MDQHYNRLSSLQCDFVERFSGLGVDRTETGTLLLKNPGRMRWAYTQPPGKVFILDGKYGWSYTPGDAQVQRVAAKQLNDLRSPLRFLLGHTRLERELQGLAVTATGGSYRVAGVPAGMQQRVAQLALDVSSDGRIQAIRLEERDGSVTEFHFAAIREGLPVPDDTFRFLPPAGVPVVDAMPPI